MAYSINPNLPKARAIAMRLLIADGLPSAVVANKCGVHRSTIWRWKQKWLEINQNVEQDKPGRPTRKTGFVAQYYRWSIRTQKSTPRRSPHAITKAVVERVLVLRAQLRRCAEVIWHHLRWNDGIRIGLSSVNRILRRHHEYDGVRKNRVRLDNPKRPIVTKPGELVQTDTIHYVCPVSRKRRYAYTVIDLYSRMAYAEIHESVRPGIAVDVIQRAQAAMGFCFSMVQADNGPEFSRYFEQTLRRSGTKVRHSRLGRPNDNAHIERFNRTIQEECTGHYLDPRTKTETVQKKINTYLDYYNTKRVHFGLQLRIPAEMLQRS